MEQRPERVIYFKDLLFSVLYQWKWMVLMALICGLLLGGVSFVKKDDTTVMNTTTLTPEYQVKIDIYKQTRAQTEAGIATQTEYLEKSLLMSLDGYTAYSAGCTVYVCPESMKNVKAGEMPYDNSAQLLRGYALALTTPQFYERLGQALGIEGRYAAEMLKTSISTNSLTVTVRGRDAQEAQKLADMARETLQAQSESLSASVEAHDLTVLPFQTGPEVDADLLSTQNTAQQKLTTLRNSWVTATTELDKLTPTELMNGSTSPVLLAAVGVMLGICLVAAVAVVAHIGSARVYSARALKDQTGVTILGCICGSKKRGAVLRWLRRLEGRSTYDQLDVAAANLGNRCGGIKKLLIMGCYQEGALAPLTAALSRKGVSCVLCGDPQNSAAALEQLPDCDGVVLVETCGISRYDRVSWALETACDHGKKPLGCVLIDG